MSICGVGRIFLGEPVNQISEPKGGLAFFEGQRGGAGDTPLQRFAKGGRCPQKA